MRGAAGEDVDERADVLGAASPVSACWTVSAGSSHSGARDFLVAAMASGLVLVNARMLPCRCDMSADGDRVPCYTEHTRLRLS